MAVDSCAEYGLKMAELGPAAVQRLEPSFPDWFPPANPVDIWPASYAKPYREIYKDSLEALLEDPGVDAVVAVMWLPILPRFEFFDASEELLAATEKYRDKPVVAFSYGPGQRDGIVLLESSRRIAAYPSVEQGLRALAAMWRRIEIGRAHV